MTTVVEKIVKKAAIFGIGACSSFLITGLVEKLKRNEIISKDTAEYLTMFLDGLLSLNLSDSKQLYALSLFLSKLIKYLMQLQNITEDTVKMTENITQFVVNKGGEFIFDDLINAGSFLAGNKLGMWAVDKALVKVDDSAQAHGMKTS